MDDPARVERLRQELKAITDSAFTKRRCGEGDVVPLRFLTGHATLTEAANEGDVQAFHAAFTAARAAPQRVPVKVFYAGYEDGAAPDPRPDHNPAPMWPTGWHVALGRVQYCYGRCLN